jgi:tetratricopeptide (TPR) repeat protein
MEKMLRKKALEASLEETERQLAAHPEAVSLRLERAGLLHQLGRMTEARNAYLDVLARAPSDRLALNNLGTLLHGTGYRTAARTAYAEAAARYPHDPLSQVNFANVLLEDCEWETAREHYEMALRSAPDHPEAHQGLSYVLAELGDGAGAARHRLQGFTNHSVKTLPYRGPGKPVSLLLLVSAAGGNIPARGLLDDCVFQTTVIVPEFYDLTQPLPHHQVIWNTIGDADLAGPALTAAQSLLALSDAPVLNTPGAVMATGRAQNAQRLANITGLIVPAMVSLPRELLASPDGALALRRHGFEYPLLLRTPGYHTGRHFVRVEDAASLAEAAAGLPGAALTAIQFLDARGADGKARKYRVMMIDGRLYPWHLAISSHWKVHYFTAEMADHPQHRAEEAEFLWNMPQVLGPRAIQALEQIQAVLGLDYAGVDFGLSPAGEVLLFETNATMVVNAPDPDDRWAYRRDAAGRVVAAIRTMLLEKAAAP